MKCVIEYLYLYKRLYRFWWLPMLDLIRDINEYDAYSKEQQEKVDAYVSDIATEVLEDIA